VSERVPEPPDSDERSCFQQVRPWPARTVNRQCRQSRGALRKELTDYLRTGRVIHRTHGMRLPDGRGSRPGILHIVERPAEAEDRAVPGHWEGDLVFGRGMSPVAGLVERSTRYLTLVARPAGNHLVWTHLHKGDPPGSTPDDRAIEVHHGQRFPRPARSAPQRRMLPVTIRRAASSGARPANGRCVMVTLTSGSGHPGPGIRPDACGLPAGVLLAEAEVHPSGRSHPLR
jgi:hypothetical protein